MMLRTIASLLLFGALCLLAAGCARTDNRTANNNAPPAAPPRAPTPETDVAQDETGPPPDVVQASVEAVELTPGRTAEAAVKLKIANGYHINGNPASKYQIATVLDVSPGEGITPVKALYPPSVSKKFSFSNEPITVYEGEAVIRQTLRAEASAKQGAQTLRARLKVQPCDDRVCYPPRTLDVSLPVNVK